ncbi:ribonuclease R [Roseomonas xinghualingensis]|uniref:ribonuclease R n=1 Tax=Roseomonas xinghualingensis TaxID=2986475 RepID=UPI0021F15907|nr:ribonuclease R [Roseomonas sp. SXEYE001]MCV4209595.1 ribonuclease R [Roseomonas sp. SXEYE001]
MAAPPPRKPRRGGSGPAGGDAPVRPRPRAAGGEPNPLPSREELRAFLRGATGRVGKTEISRHFGLSSDQRPALRALMAELKEEGSIASVGRRTIRHSANLPDMAALEVFGLDADGEPMARPITWDGAEKPVVYMRPERPGQPALAPGDRVLARITRIGGNKYEGRTFKRIGGGSPSRILGIYSPGLIEPVDRRVRTAWIVPPGQENGAEEGELVLAELIPGGSRERFMGPKPVRVVERLGRMDEPRAVSRLCIAAHRIPAEFPDEAVKAAERARAVPLVNRDDLRDIPLVTIDGEDARDFDDAVFAEPDGDGWRIIVAIADVAHYVRTASPLDREAKLRGNSVYFPDRVVPMLPEALSNGWCSLKPDADRGCLYVEMRFDREGMKTGHRFGRGLMRSAARLTYEQVQAARDAAEDAGLAPGHIARLYGAFDALLAARLRRGTLDLDIPERRVILDPDGKVLSVAPRPRFDSHRLIEEFMVAANVCAAEELERLHMPCMYRIHDRPSDEKMETLRSFLGGFGITLPPSSQVKPRDFAHILDKMKDAPESRLVSETILRGQSQAEYNPDNIGHFGLALPRYAHFTSPIRRYADLLVHRALIRGLKLGDDGLTDAEAAQMPDTGEHITKTERRAALAERDAVDRYLAAFMADRVGVQFLARVSGVTRFGLFVTLEENGASGIVPTSALPDDQWLHEEAAMRLIGRRTGLTFTLGQEVEVRLSEAVPRTGSLTFQLMQGDPRATPAPRQGTPPRGRQKITMRQPKSAKKHRR